MFWHIQVYTAALVFIRFFTYLRAEDEFSWLVRLITAVVSDMRQFMFVLFIGIFAFADMFLSEKQILMNKGLIDPYEPMDPTSLSERYLGAYFREWTISF